MPALIGILRRILAVYILPAIFGKKEKTKQDVISDFIKEYNKLTKKYSVYIVPDIVFFKNNKQVVDKDEIVLVRKNIDKLLQSKQYGISAVLGVAKKDDSSKPS